VRESTQTLSPRLSTILSIPDLQHLMKEPREHKRNCHFCGITIEKWDGEYCNKCDFVRKHGSKNTWEQLRNAKKDNLSVYIKVCGVPKILQNIPQSKEEMESLFITGGFGTGKTYKAVGILKKFIQNLPCSHFIEPFIDIPIFITVPELLLKIRGCFSHNGQSESEELILEKYWNTPLLILDDLGAEKTTEWVLQSLYIIINKRLSEERQTIITSNLSLDELREKIGDRIASRVAGMCKIVKLTGKDRRLKQ